MGRGSGITLIFLGVLGGGWVAVWISTYARPSASLSFGLSAGNEPGGSRILALDIASERPMIRHQPPKGGEQRKRGLYHDERNPDR